jgi:proton-dependent oligopeptide transporter, POT family
MYFYFAINLGSLTGLLTVLLEHRVGFWAAYTLPLSAFVVALAVAIGGRHVYILRKPQGSIILDALKALRIAAKNGWKLDAAKPENNPGVKWDNQFIEELKRALVACKVHILLPNLMEIFLFYPIYWMTYGQMDASLGSMSTYMRTDGFPNDLLNNFNPLTLIVCIPLVDRFLYPGLRKIGFKMRPITRITIGFWIGVLAMAYCAIIQVQRFIFLN